jgi:hypothetical protein
VSASLIIIYLINLDFLIKNKETAVNRLSWPIPHLLG